MLRQKLQEHVGLLKTKMLTPATVGDSVAYQEGATHLKIYTFRQVSMVILLAWWCKLLQPI
jgi:hypothetical protein